MFSKWEENEIRMSSFHFTRKKSHEHENSTLISWRVVSVRLFFSTFLRWLVKIHPDRWGVTVNPTWWTALGCGRPIPGSVQRQIGWGSEQPRLVEDVIAHGRQFRTRWSLKASSNPGHSIILSYHYCCIMTSIFGCHQQDYSADMQIKQDKMFTSCPPFKFSHLLFLKSALQQ